MSKNRTYFYRAADKQGNTVDFLLTAKRDKKAARRFLNKAIGRNGKPGLINIDKSGANTAAIQGYNDDHNKRIKFRQCRAMLGFKSFLAAQKTLAGNTVNPVSTCL